MDSILSVERKRCTGCGACVRSCPEQAIDMKKTVEGFAYPYVDPNACNMCSKCAEKCPLLCPSEKGKAVWYSFAAEDFTRWNAVGGAALWVIMDAFASQGGVIYASAFTDHYDKVTYRSIKFSREWGRVCQIPFLEGDASEVFPEIQRSLTEDGKTLFVGTACQIDGLLCFLGGRSDNLLTVELVCEGTAPGDLWRDYIRSRIGDEAATEIKLYSKELGGGPSVRIRTQKDVYREVEKGDWLTPYMEGHFLRKSCYECSYGSMERIGDIVVGVFSQVQRGDGKGTSLLGFRSSGAEEWFREAVQDKKVMLAPVSLGAVQKGLGSAGGRKEPPERKDFFEKWFTHGYMQAVSDREKSRSARGYVLDYHAGDAKAWIILNPDAWGRRTIGDTQYLLPSSVSWQRIFLPLERELKRGIRYGFSIKIKVNTNVQGVRIMLSNKNTQDGGCPILQTLRGFSPHTWCVLNGSYVPRNDGLRWIMLTSTDFKGADSYLCFQWIRIWEE